MRYAVRTAWIPVIISLTPLCGRADNINVPRPVSGFLGSNYDPAVSPNGRYLAYTSTAGGNEDIWIVDLNRNERWQVTHNTLSDYSPAFLGNDEIIFISTRESSGGGIFITDKSGEKIRKISGGRGYYDSPSVSPDRRRFAYVNSVNGERPRIYIHNLKDNTTRPGPPGLDPSFSSSGKEIVFAAAMRDSIASPGMGIYDIEKDSTSFINLSGMVVSNPRFSPDGMSIVFARHISDTDRDGKITRNDLSELARVSLSDGNIGLLYPGYRLGEPAVPGDSTIYAVSEKFDIYSLSLSGIIPRLESPELQIRACDSLLRLAITPADSLMTAAVCTESYFHYPNSCERYLFVAAGQYGALGRTDRALEILDKVSRAEKNDLGLRAALMTVKLAFLESLRHDSDHGWDDAQREIRNIMQDEEATLDIIKEGYLLGIELSNRVGRFDDSNSLLVEAMLLFTGDEEYGALLEMWRLRNISGSFRGDPADMAPLFVDYLDRFSGRPALADSVVYELIEQTRRLDPEIALVVLENLRFKYQSYEKLASLCTLEQGRLLERSGRTELAEWKYEEALQSCPRCDRIRFEAYLSLGDVNLRQNDFAAAEMYFDSAGFYIEHIESYAVRNSFYGKYGLLKSARGYDVLERDPSAAALFFHEAVLINEKDQWAVWGLARSLSRLDDRKRWDNESTIFASESMRSYFKAVRYIVNFVSDRDVSSLNDARDLLKRAIDLDFEYPPPYLSLGYVDCALEAFSQENMGLYEEAVEYSEYGSGLAAADLSFRSAFSLNAAEAYFGLRQYESAFEKFREALALDADLIPDDMIDLYLARYGDSGFQLDSLDVSRKSYSRLYDTAVESGNLAKQAAYSRKLGMISQLNGDYLEGVEHYETALPYYLSRRDYTAAANVHKAEAACYHGYGNQELAAESARESLEFMKMAGKRPKSGDQRIKLIIKPLGIVIPTFKVGSMVYGGSAYPHGFTEAADRAYLLSIISTDPSPLAEIRVNQEKIEILTEGKERHVSASIYNDLGLRQYSLGYFDSAAVSFLNAYSISINEEMPASALNYLSNMATAVFSGPQNIESDPAQVRKVEKESSNLHARITPSDFQARATLRNLQGVCEMTNVLVDVKNVSLEADGDLENWLGKLDKEAGKFRIQLEIARDMFREGLSEVAFEEKPVVGATLSLNEAVVSYILGDIDAYRTAISRAGKEASLSESEVVNNRFVSWKALVEQDAVSADSADRALSVYENIAAMRSTMNEAVMAEHLYRKAVSLSLASGDSVEALDYLERSKQASLLNHLKSISPEIYGDDLLKAYVRQVRSYQKELLKLRGREIRFRALGTAGQVGLKKVRDDILSLRSMILELKEKIGGLEPGVIPFIFFENFPTRSIIRNIPSNEVCIIPYVEDRSRVIWIADSSGVTAVPWSGGNRFLPDVVSHIISASDVVAVGLDGEPADSLANALSLEFPGKRIKRCYSLNEEYGGRQRDFPRLEGVGVIRFDGSILDGEQVEMPGAEFLNVDSLGLLNEKRNFGWVIIDGRLNYDARNPLLSYWCIPDSGSVPEPERRLHVYELFGLFKDSFGCILTGMSRPTDPAAGWTVLRSVRDWGFRSLIAIDQSVDQDERVGFVRTFLESYKEQSSLDAYRSAAESAFGGAYDSGQFAYFGEEGWNRSDRREKSGEWFDILISRGDSAVTKGDWVAAAGFFGKARSHAGSAGIGADEMDMLSHRIIETNREGGQYESALQAQANLIERAGEDMDRLILRWQEYRDIARDAGNIDLSLKASEEVLSLAGMIGDESMEAESYIHLAEDHFNQGNFRESIEFAAAAANKSRVVYDTVLAVEAYAILGRACLDFGEYERGENALDQGLALCEEKPLENRRHELLMYLGEYYGDRGRLPEGRRALTEALVYFEDAGDDIFASRCRYDLALNFGRSDRPVDALRYTDSILAENPNDVEALILSSVMLRNTGRLDSSYHQASRAAGLPGPLGSILLLSKAHGNLGDILYAMEDYQGAAEQYRLAIEYYRRDSTLAYPGLLHYKLATSRPDSAVVDTELMLEIMGQTEDESVENLCGYQLAMAYLDSGAKDKAREQLEEILASGDEFTSRRLKWRAAYALRRVFGEDRRSRYLALADALYGSYPPEPEFVKKEYHLREGTGAPCREAALLSLESNEPAAAADYYEKAWLCGLSSAHMSRGDFDKLETDFLDYCLQYEGVNSGGRFEAARERFFGGNDAYSSLWGKAPATIDELRKTLNLSQCVLRYYSLPEKLAVFYIDYDTVAYNIVMTADIEPENAALQFADALRLATTADSMLESWYTILLAPFEDLIEEHEEMLMIPDGPLISFPLEAFKRPSADYIGETHRIVRTVHLPGEFPSDRIGSPRPCADDENMSGEMEVVSGIVEILGGCRDYDDGRINFVRGEYPPMNGDQNVVLICNLEPVRYDREREDFYLYALRAARDGRAGMLQTTWSIPDQPLSYFYWVFLRSLMTGKGLDRSYKSASSYLFGRFRGLPYYWAFSAPYHLN